MEEARELLLKHLYLQGGDGLGISDGRVYNACLDAIMEALTIPVVVKPFYCGADENHNAGRCKNQCRLCSIDEEKK
jgi:hypothetical protein